MSAFLSLKKKNVRARLEVCGIPVVVCKNERIFVAFAPSPQEMEGWSKNKKISKVSALVYLLWKAAEQRTFER